ncbi:MAG: 2'-5' RNA ligase family protein [Propionibacteriaceae bacterium]
MEALAMVNHWVDKPEWSNDRRLWAFYLTFGHDVDVHEFAAAHQSNLRALRGLDLVDPPWFHLTIQGVAFTDQVDDEALDRLCDAVADQVADQPVLELRLGPPFPDDDAIVIPVAAEPPLEVLRDRLRRVATQTLDRGELYALPEPVGGFAPHITIAYCNAAAPLLSDVNDRLAAVGPAELEVRASHLSLLRLRREPTRWSWDRETRIPLGRAAAGQAGVELRTG